MFHFHGINSLYMERWKCSWRDQIGLLPPKVVWALQALLLVLSALLSEPSTYIENTSTFKDDREGINVMGNEQSGPSI